MTTLTRRSFLARAGTFGLAVFFAAPNRHRKPVDLSATYGVATYGTAVYGGYNLNAGGRKGLVL